MEVNANEIIKKLWLGNKYAASDKHFLISNSITNIINVSDHIDNYFINEKQYNYMRVPINNDLDSISILKDSLPKIIQFINTAIDNNQSILVHCKKGHRRSALIVAYYIMKKYNCSFEMAKIKIRSKRTNTLKEPLVLKEALLC